MNGGVPAAIAVNEAFPDVTHMIELAGCVPMDTGIQVELTVTVTVNVVPLQVPDVGVTV